MSEITNTSMEGKQCHRCGMGRITNGRCLNCGWSVTIPPVPPTSRVSQTERDYWSKLFDTERKDK